MNNDAVNIINYAFNNMNKDFLGLPSYRDMYDKRLRLKVLACTTNNSSLICVFRKNKYYLYIDYRDNQKWICIEDTSTKESMAIKTY